MPFGDRTGPAGLGPMTGRAAGYCSGHPVPGYMNPMPGAGCWGRGAYYSGVIPAYGAPLYGIPGYTGYYPGFAIPRGGGRGRFAGYFPRFGHGFGHVRGRW